MAHRVIIFIGNNKEGSSREELYKHVLARKNIYLDDPSAFEARVVL